MKYHFARSVAFREEKRKSSKKTITAFAWGTFTTHAKAAAAQEEVMRRTMPFEVRETVIYRYDKPSFWKRRRIGARRWRFDAGMPIGYAMRKIFAKLDDTLFTNEAAR